MKKLILVGLVLGLSACTYSAEQEQADLTSLNSSLGKTGCTISYAGPVRVEGSYHEAKVFLTTCKATSTATISENQVVQQGKTTRMDTTVSVDTDYSGK